MAAPPPGLDLPVSLPHLLSFCAPSCLPVLCTRSLFLPPSLHLSLRLSSGGLISSKERLCVKCVCVCECVHVFVYIPVCVWHSNCLSLFLSLPSSLSLSLSLSLS